MVMPEVVQAMGLIYGLRALRAASAGMSMYNAAPATCCTSDHLNAFWK